MNLYVKNYLKKLLRQGGGFKRAYRELLQSRCLSPAQIKDLQNKKLQKIIRHCYKNVPYYTDLFNNLKFKPEDVACVEDLGKLPFIDKYIVKDNFDKLIAKNKLRFLCYETHTSGTTGTPGRIMWDKNSVDWEYAAIKRFYEGAPGCGGGARKMAIRGNPIKPVDDNTPPFWQLNKLNNELMFSAYHFTPANAPLYIQKIEEFNPEIFYAYPSTAYLLAKYLEDTPAAIKLKAIFTSSEMFPDDKRKVIEEVFECPVFDWYGQVERVAAISQCEKGTHHIQEDYSIVEIIENEVVGTHLHNFIMPLIRYKTTDTVDMSADACSCGCTFRSVSKIYGKNPDNYRILTPQGEKFTILLHIPRGVDSVVETQFIQERAGELIINVTTNGKFTEQDREKLIQKAHSLISADMKITVNELDQIPRGPNGKFINVINKVVT